MTTFNKHLGMLTVIATLGLGLLMGIGPAAAQSSANPHHPPAAAAPAAGTPVEPPAGGMPMMEMCRQMMGGPMTGMAGEQKMDPKMMAHMLQMRGEMMKAMGEVMMKHGRMMGGATN